MALYLGDKLIASIQRILRWGDVQGNIEDQVDLKNALDSKVDKTTTVNGKALSTNISLTASDVGALSRITSSDVTEALGYTPYDGATNPNNYVDTTDLGTETTNREEADADLQDQIDALSVASDVSDVVGTYQELQDYDTSTLQPNNIVKVLQDETRNNQVSYYRWVITSDLGEWTYVGGEGPYYTKGQADLTFVPQTRTINGSALSADLTLGASDVGALSDTTKYAANLSYTDDTLQLKDQDGNNIGSGVIITSGGTITIDQVYDPTSENAQSGVAIAGAGFLTQITSSDVTNALGYTPYNSTNPAGYTSNVGTVTSVNNVEPVNGNVTLSIPSEVTESTVSGWGFTKNEGTVTSVNNTSPVNGNVTLSIPSEVTENTVSGWGFTKNEGTVTSVNNTSPDNNGNVTLSIPSEVTESTVSGWGFTKNEGTVTSVNNVEPVNGNVTIAIPSEVTESTVSGWGFTKNEGTITGITMNGSSMGTSGVIDLGTVITDISGKQDTLVSGTNIKTINNESILGSGNITISGGGGTWGSITGTLSDQTDLQDALDAKSTVTFRDWS